MSPSWLEFGEGDIATTKLELAEQEKELLSLYRQLNERDKDALVRMTRGLSKFTYD